MRIFCNNESYIGLRFCIEEIDALTEAGPAATATALIVSEHLRVLNKLPRETIEKALAVSGAWTRDELKTCAIEYLYQRLVWYAAGLADKDTREAYVETY